MKPFRTGLGLYRLEGHEVIRLEEPVDFNDWASQYDRQTIDERRVAETTVGDRWVSTVFLGLDYSFGFWAEPRVFETMIFGPDDEAEVVDRYSTWAEAEAGHELTVRTIQRHAEAFK